MKQTMLALIIFLLVNCQKSELSSGEIQKLLNEGSTPIELYNQGVSKEQLYGKLYENGLIFYLNIDDGWGLLSAINDISEVAPWGCLGLIDGAKLTILVDGGEEIEQGARIGDGNTNTEKILQSCSETDIAARLCVEIGNGWFLPSRGELYLMMINLHLNGHGNFVETDYYWSSTSKSVESGWGVNSDLLYSTGNKANLRYVRAVKKFE